MEVGIQAYECLSMCKERRGVQGWNEMRPLPEEPAARSEERQFRGEDGPSSD